MSIDQILTKREMEICGMIAKGLNSERIAGLLFLSEGTVKNYVTSIYQKTGLKNRAQLAAVYAVENAHVMTDVSPPGSDALYPASVKPEATLRLVGSSGLPGVISIAFEKRPFVIGRFDASIGCRQCDFEFDKTTKGVSRRHASIASSARGCTIVDLESSAGTFVNSSRITPGEPHPLNSGDHVSFGGAGADYIFELFI